MENNDLDWGEFSAAVRLLKSGVSKMYFRDVVFAATGRRILPFNTESEAVLNDITEWLDSNLADISNLVEMHYVGRPNELGNHVERLLMARLEEEMTFHVDTPTTEHGRRQAAGYPDGVIFDLRRDTVVYFDVKIFQEKTKDSTLRSFYYQPTNQNKILHDAPHFLIAFKVKSLGDDNRSPFIIQGYEIVDIHALQVNFKAEFNASNRDLYSGG